MYIELHQLRVARGRTGVFPSGHRVLLCDKVGFHKKAEWAQAIWENLKRFESLALRLFIYSVAAPARPAKWVSCEFPLLTKPSMFQAEVIDGFAPSKNEM